MFGLLASLGIKSGESVIFKHKDKYMIGRLFQCQLCTNIFADRHHEIDNSSQWQFQDFQDANLKVYKETVTLDGHCDLVNPCICSKCLKRIDH